MVRGTMKILGATFACLVLTTALGFRLNVQNHITQPSDCCFQYTTRTIRCTNMIAYMNTTSQCSKPAVIFLTKCGQKVCTNPWDQSVQRCIWKLNQKPMSQKPWGMEQPGARCNPNSIPQNPPHTAPATL